MNHFDATLVARAFNSGRAIRSAKFRHRGLVPDPLTIVAWQLGSEPFSAAALGWGDSRVPTQMAVAGEPRNRDLALAALLKLARWFNPRFEAHATDRETFTRGKNTITVARTAPQVVVANRATVELLGRLGRRLAYLPIEGPHPADPALVQFGRHLRFLWEHHARAGQQLLVGLTDLLNDHWATPLSAAERQSLPALDAYIDPPFGVNGFDAAAAAEVFAIGPSPAGDDDERLFPLVDRFNQERGKSTDPAVVAPLLRPIVAHYQPLLWRTWELVWRCRDREATHPEARSVRRRWDEDRDAYTRHIDWLARSGLRRTRQTPRQAATTLTVLEEAGRRVEAEEACDDPMRMAPYVLDHKAVRGTVVAVDLSHKEPGPKRPVGRPLVTLRSPDPCLIPIGRELWWSDHSDGREYVVETVTPTANGGADVVLKLMTSAAPVLPVVGATACFSIHTVSAEWRGTLPVEDPWTHRPATPMPPVEPFEDTAPMEV